MKHNNRKRGPLLVLAMLLLPGLALRAQTLADLLPQYIAATENLTKILSGVKDSATATAALPNIETAISQLEAVKAKLKQIKPNVNDQRDAGAAKQDGERLQQASQKLQEEVQRLRSMRKLKEKVSELLARLK